jgi:hypothetical protein
MTPRPPGGETVSGHVMGAPRNVQRRKLSLDEFQRMGAAGILREDDRVELIDGEMIEKAPIGRRQRRPESPRGPRQAASRTPTGIPAFAHSPTR